jgi:ribose/xylose/arabinose/galactoside ABC-type transport system permease subunit
MTFIALTCSLMLKERHLVTSSVHENMLNRKVKYYGLGLYVGLYIGEQIASWALHYVVVTLALLTHLFKILYVYTIRFDLPNDFRASQRANSVTQIADGFCYSFGIASSLE